MATTLLPETAQKLLTQESLRSAAKQSQRCLTTPVRLRRAIKKYLREQDEPHMKRKVLRLSESFSQIKDVNSQLVTATSQQLVEDPLRSVDQSQRWKIRSNYGDIGLTYRDDETIAYVASRMPAVFSACHRVLKEVRQRIPEFSPAKVLDFGAGTGSAFWALREVWPHSLEKVNLVEPSQSMQRAGQKLTQGQKNLPLIHSYDSLQSLTKSITKSEREHDLVIASYVLGEIPSLKDRITIVRQLWDLTQDVLVLIEPGTPQGSSIISQMRSHILWMEKRKCRKSKDGADETSKDLVTQKSGAFIVAPCSHDGHCPLEKAGKYCHFVQRLVRTSVQRAFKRSKGGQPLRGFEDEKFSFVAFRRGQRPREPWPLDGMKFETLKEQHAKRSPEDLEIELEVRQRIPEFSPAKVLDFGAGTGSAFWALREVWPHSLEKVNLVEPSQSMQRAGQKLTQGQKNLPLIHSYDSLQSLTKSITKSEREHDLVIASYVLGEIPSLKDRITIVRQLWDLTQDVLVLIEPGTPQGSSIISQMRSHILWMEKRKCRKSKDGADETSKDLVTQKSGAFIVAPCSHDGHCPLEKAGKYCHFVQRLVRTSVQRAFKRSKGGQPLRGFEDEKFSFVAFRRGQRPREPWPLDGMKFETLKEQHAKRSPEDLEIELDELISSQQADLVPFEEPNPVNYDSDVMETDVVDENDKNNEEEDETGHADLGGGWGRIIYMPVRRGKQVTMDVCRSTKRDGSEGELQRVVVTKSKNPTLHLQARKSIWGDLWPF